jgi:hypothetical protein
VHKQIQQACNLYLASLHKFSRLDCIRWKCSSFRCSLCDLQAPNKQVAETLASRCSVVPSGVTATYASVWLLRLE